MMSHCGRPFGFIIHKLSNAVLMLFLFWGMPKQIWLSFITWICSDQIHYINSKLTKYCSSVLHFFFYFFNIQVLFLQSRNMAVLSFIEKILLYFARKTCRALAFTMKNICLHVEIQPQACFYNILIFQSIMGLVIDAATRGVL